MNGYKVSVLVPIYNVEKYIEQCACSLFEQTLRNIEYIFIDDCGTDASMTILDTVIEKYPEKKHNVKIIHNEYNIGLGKSRNKAVEAAVGDYVYHIDSDDFIEKNTIELLYDKAKDSDADIVTAEYYLYWENMETYRLNYPVIEDSKKFFHQLLNKQIPSYLCNKLIRRSLYKDNSIAVPDGINFMEDFATLPRLVFYSKCINHLSVPLYYYRQNQNSYCHTLTESSIVSAFKAINTIDTFLSSQNTMTDSIIADRNYCKLQTKLMLTYAAPELSELICQYYPSLQLGNLRDRFNFRERLLLNYIYNNEHNKIRLLVKTMKIASRLKNLMANFCTK